MLWRAHGWVLFLLFLTHPAVADQVPDTTARPVSRKSPLTELVVTATRTSQQVGAVAANVTILDQHAAATAPGQMVPGLLARIPGYASRDYQNPLLTSPARSAPSFRGLGGSSAGRTLVLFDGVPLNEPFGGSVHWGRVPLALVDRIEVVRGGGSMAWGSRALGGVINIMTATPERNHLDLGVEGGGFGTVRGSAAGTLRHNGLRVMAGGSWEETGGFQVIRPDQAGAVDLPTGSNHKMLLAKVAYDIGKSGQAYLAGNYLDEWHQGPTAADSGPATVGEIRGGARLVTSGGGVLALSGYGNHRTSMIIATNVSSDRSTETPRSYQNAPSDGVGASVQWSQSVGRHGFTAGSDLSGASGTTVEDYGWLNGAMTLRRQAQGRQVLLGGFVQDGIDLGRRWRLQGGVRYDWVHDDRGRRVEQRTSNGEILADTSFGARVSNRLNFSAGVRHEATHWLSWRASAYQAFRAPTLSEMYRPNKGTGRGSITESNATLRPERLSGVELGVDLTLGERTLVRVGGFWNEVRDPIVDYTIGIAATNGQVIEPCGVLLKDQVCRQRRNVDALRTVGVETEVEFHPHTGWSFWGSYTFNPTRLSAPGQQTDGKAARSAAEHVVSGFVAWENPRLMSLTLEARYVGPRFDDDINSIRLGSFTAAGFRLDRPLWRQASAYLKVENLLNAKYEVTRSTTGIAEMGGPRWVLLGLRAAW